MQTKQIKIKEGFGKDLKLFFYILGIDLRTQNICHNLGNHIVIRECALTKNQNKNDAFLKLGLFYQTGCKTTKTWSSKILSLKHLLIRKINISVKIQNGQDQLTS